MKPLAPIHWPYLGVHIGNASVISPEQKRGKRWKWLAKLGRPLMVTFLTVSTLILAAHCVRIVSP